MASAFVTKMTKITTTGADGAAVGTGVISGLTGYLTDIYIDYHASAPSSIDVTVAYADRGGDILVVSNNNTDGMYCPRKQNCNSAGAAISGDYDRYVIDGNLNISIAQADALTACVTVYVRVQQVP